jgi:hypothetical protein
MMYEHCNVADQAFASLAARLDEELTERYGAGQAQYDTYTRIPDYGSYADMENSVCYRKMLHRSD